MNYKPKKIMDVFEGRYVECQSEKDKNSSVKGYLEKIRPHLHAIVDLKKSDERKTNETKFLSSTDSSEKRMMYSKGDSSIVMIGNDAVEIIQKLFD